MTCSEFLERHSEYYDGELLPEEAESFRRHLTECTSCSRFDRALSVGTKILKENPPQLLRDDFRERLRFAIYREEMDTKRRGGTYVGTGVAIGVGVAATVAVTMAFALLREVQPAAEVSPIAALPPEAASAASPLPLFDSTPSSPPTFEELDLWAGSNVLLYENSPLFRRHQGQEILTAERR